MGFHKWIFVVLMGSATLNANDSFNSEVSHFAGGAGLAGGITAVVNRYYPEYQNDRGMIGFGASSAAIIVVEGINTALSGDAKGQLLDIASHIAGSALGAFVTDQYLLSPVISDSSKEGKYIGMSVQKSF